MIDRPTQRNRFPLHWLAPAIALALAIGTTGCGIPFLSNSSADKPSAASETLTAALEQPTALPTRAIAGETSRYDAAAEYSARHGGHALVVVEGGEVVFAVGQNGHAIDDAHPLYNASLSFWGPLAIAAERDGLLDLDERVSATIEEFEDVRWKKDMRVRQLLDYTSGLEAGFRPLIQEKPKNHYRRSLTLAMVAPPGERFQFGPSHLAVFGEVLRRKLAPKSSDPLSYLKEHLLDPIGLKISSWERDADGNINLAGGAILTAEEWAKFGILIRDRGVWNGKTLLKASDLEACFQGSKAQARFGMTFWLNALAPDSAGGAGALNAKQAFYPDGLDDLIVAAGYGNQRLFAIPSLDLVVTRLGKPEPGWRDPDFLALLVAAREQRRAPVGDPPQSP